MLRLELHMLQNFAPSNLNRDDTGSPKDCELGGYRRARISSQCIKRSVREFFKTMDLIPAADRGERTKRLAAEATRLLTLNKHRDGALAQRAANAAVSAFLPKSAANNQGELLTPYLLFLGQRELSGFADLVDTHWESFSAAVTAPETATAEVTTSAKKGPGKTKAPKAEAPKAPNGFAKAVEGLLKGKHAADVALFGRMLADNANLNVDAACQVAHAVSTNRIHSMEMDYFTAVDDLKPDDTAGADMIGTVEFNSPCYYRYANLDIEQLLRNLQQDRELAAKTVEAFVRASVLAIPSGKQNTFAAQNLPSLVFAVVRKGPPMSLTNAFVKPVAPHANGPDLVEGSIAALVKHYGDLAAMYGSADVAVSAVCVVGDAKLGALESSRVGSLAELLAKVLPVANALPTTGARPSAGAKEAG